MNPASRLTALKARDIAIKGVSQCGAFRVMVATTTNLVNDCLKRCDDQMALMPDTETQRSAVEQFATCCTFTNLMASTLQDEERFNIKFQGPNCTSNVESLALGECRGKLHYIPSEKDDEAITLSWEPADPEGEEGALSGGVSIEEQQSFEASVTVATRILYGKSAPVVSATVFKPKTKNAARNFTPHGAHFLKTSDGVPSAVLLMTALRRGAELPAAPVLWSGGIVVQALAADAEQDSSMKMRQKLFDKLWSATDPQTIADETSRGGSSRLGVMETLSRRNELQGLLAHDLIQIATGSKTIARDVASRCRLNVPHGDRATSTESNLSDKSAVETAAAMPLPPLETVAGDDELLEGLQLDLETVTRTPLDYYCRCSKADFVGGLPSMGEQECRNRYEVDPSMSMQCAYCRKEHSMTEEDWKRVFLAFAKAA